MDSKVRTYIAGIFGTIKNPKHFHLIHSIILFPYRSKSLQHESTIIKVYIYCISQIIIAFFPSYRCLQNDFENQSTRQCPLALNSYNLAQTRLYDKINNTYWLCRFLNLYSAHFSVFLLRKSHHKHIFAHWSIKTTKLIHNLFPA